MFLLLSAAECWPDEPAAEDSPRAGPMLGKEAGQERDDNGVKMELVWCPPGKFRMGSPESENGRIVYSPADKPPYTDEEQVDVTLTKGFWLGKYEVTQDEWRRVMGTAPWKKESAEYVNKGVNFPAMYVTWDDAILAIIGVTFSAFCIWLTVRIVTRRKKWAIWTAVWLAEAVGILGSAYCTIFYGWLTATPLSPQGMRTAVFCAYASMTAFVLTACAGVVTFVIFVRRQNSTASLKPPTVPPGGPSVSN
ncbi:MAG: formylglycine-generating enzyme family protein [Planctomycetales bacterium]